MSLMGKHSPRRTRNQGNGSQSSKIKLQEVRSSPVVKTEAYVPEPEPANNQEMLDVYKFKPQEEKEEVCSEGAQLVLKESKLLPEDTRSYCPPFGFYELQSKCTASLIKHLWDPIDPRLKAINDLNKKYTYEKLEIVSDSKKEVQFEMFRDTLYYLKGEVVILEEQYNLSGFLREYFDIEQVIVLGRDGSLLSKPCGYCNFWFRDTLDKFFSGRLPELTSTEIQDYLSCNSCCFNTSCDFSKSTKV